MVRLLACAQVLLAAQSQVLRGMLAGSFREVRRLQRCS